MLSWLGKQVISYNMKRLRAGDPKPTLRMDAPDVRMVFPGQSTWATDLRGKAEHERWLRRFTQAGIQIVPDEVIVKGFPCNTTVCVRGHDHLDTPPGGARVREPPCHLGQDRLGEAQGLGGLRGHAEDRDVRSLAG